MWVQEELAWGLVERPIYSKTDVGSREDNKKRLFECTYQWWPINRGFLYKKNPEL